MIKYLLLLFVCFVYLSCGAQHDASYAPGVCALDCSTSIISDSEETEINLLGSENITINCADDSGNAPYQGSVSLRFGLKTQRSTKILGEKLRSSPQPNISFEAVVMSGIMDRDVFPEGVSPDEFPAYKGIKTSHAEWCTDSCGVGMIELVPWCTTDTQEVKVLLRSGSVAKEVTITVKVPEAEAPPV